MFFYMVGKFSYGWIDIVKVVVTFHPCFVQNFGNRYPFSLSSTESFVLTIYFIKTLTKVVIPAQRASHCIGPPRQTLYDRKYSFTQRRTSEEVQHPADQLGFEYLGLVVWEIVT